MTELTMPHVSVLFIRTMFFMCFLFTGMAYAQGVDVDKLNQEANSLYQQNKFEEAAAIIRKILDIRERELGPDHLDVASSLVRLAGLYATQGKLSAAEDLLKRALVIRESSVGLNHLLVASTIDNLAKIYFLQNQFVITEDVLKRSITIRENVLGSDHAVVAESINALAEFYRIRGRFADADMLYRRALEIRVKSLGAMHPDVAQSNDFIGVVFYQQGQYADAEQFFVRALEINEKALGVNHLNVAISLDHLALNCSRQGKHVQSEKLNARALTIREKNLGLEHPSVADSLNNLADDKRELGRYAQAEPLYKRSLAINEKLLGYEHPNVVHSLYNLALNFLSQGKDDAAELLVRRALPIAERTFGSVNLNVSALLALQGQLYKLQGQYQLSVPLLRRVLEINEKLVGADHPRVAGALNNLAELYRAQDQYDAAEPLYVRSLTITEKALGSEHPLVASTLNNLASMYADQFKYALAEPILRRALLIYENAFGAEHPNAASVLQNLARLHLRRGEYAEAALFVRRATKIYATRALQVDGSGVRAEQRIHRSHFFQHLDVLMRLPIIEHDDRMDEGLRVIQLALASSVGQSVAQMAARFAAKGDELANLVRQTQDMSAQLARVDKFLIEEVGQPPAKFNSVRMNTLRQRVSELENSLADQTKAISTRFPEYEALVSPAPIGLAEAQKLLTQDEALVVYLVEGKNAFAWALRSGKADFKKLDITAKDLEATVNQLRSKLDPLQNPGILSYDAAAAYQLYQKVLAPIESILEGAKHLIVVADGALQSLPMSVLVTRPPARDAQPVWLADRYAVSVVPSVSALRALRTFTKRQPAPEPFVGFGNPVLTGSTSEQRNIAMRGLFLRGTSGDAGTGIADVEAIRQAPSLPETADELRALAKTLSAAPESVHLANSATETRAKEMDLSRYRVLAFATHGVMAGEIKGIAEPGLILTPPEMGTVQDDGYLSASEVAQLKLNADWVLLSACNTAAPDDAPGAEGLSGLAKGFFYAGARSLLVSNWYVVSDATVLITTEMLKNYADNPKLGKAEALRQSMQKMRADPKYSHPLFWAPFMVVGEGGAG